MKYNFIKISVYILIVIIVVFLANYLLGLFKGKDKDKWNLSTINSSEPETQYKTIDGVEMVRVKWNEQEGWSEWTERYTD